MPDESEVVDVEVVHEPDEPGRYLPAETRPALAVTPQVPASELVARLNVIRDAMEHAMQRDIDYGVIPGTGSKPTLLKPGAEKLGVLFQLDVQIVNEKTWAGKHLTVSSLATVYHIPTGARVGFGEGMCSTRERKYARREQKRTCPSCGKPTIFKSKPPQTGWYCWAKKGGCGANYAGASTEAQKIEAQKTNDIANPDLPDTWNTVVKMAEKRARIDAILAVTGASALFTQDMDDHVERAPDPAPRAQAAPKPKPEAPPTPPVAVTALKAAAAGLTGKQIRAAFGAAKIAVPWVGRPDGKIFDRLEPSDADILLACLGKQHTVDEAERVAQAVPWEQATEDDEALAARLAAESFGSPSV